MWSPWVFVIAASIGLLSSLGSAVNTVSDRARDPERAERAKERLTEVLVDLPAGLRYAPSPIAERQMIEQSFRAQVSEPGSDVEVRRIVRSDGARGLVIAIVGEQAGDLKDFEKGFEARGGPLETERAGAGEILTGRDNSGNFVAITGEGDAAVMAFGVSARDARSFILPFVPD